MRTNPGGRPASCRQLAEPLIHFPQLWPRNFAIAFLVEALLAQPVARMVMRRYHHHVDSRGGRGAEA